MTICRTIGDDASLAITLKECVLAISSLFLALICPPRTTEEAYRVFQDTIEAHARSLGRAQLVRPFATKPHFIFN